MNDTQSATETRYETADIPVLRRALLADAQAHAERAADLYRATEGPITGTALTAWSALALADSHNRLLAAVLGIAGRDPGLTAASRAQMARLVGQVLDGWPEGLEGANDDLRAETEPQIEGQGVLSAESARGFRVGDLVEITARASEGERTPPGLRLIGRAGYVSEFDAESEYPIGVSVEGWLGPVWCNSGEIRHADSADCPSCRGSGSHREPDPGDGEFESDRECLDCDGTGRVVGATGTVETAGSAT